jgi:hypothetical protein
MEHTTLEMAEKTLASALEDVKKYTALKAEAYTNVAVAKAQIQQIQQTKCLRLRVQQDGCLEILYGESQIGFISAEGRVYILSTTCRREVYYEWLEAGCVTDNSWIHWNGGQYMIEDIDGDIILRRVDISAGNIFDFISALPLTACADNNIQVYTNNRTPIMF